MGGHRKGTEERLHEGSDCGAGLYAMGRISTGGGGHWEGISGRENSISKGIKMGTYKHVRQIVSIWNIDTQKGGCKGIYIRQPTSFPPQPCEVGPIFIIMIQVRKRRLPTAK